MFTQDLSRREHGLSLIELIIFIVIIGVAIAGVLLAIDRTARASADPVVTKQALAIAEALLDEVELMPFTFCDPDDAQAGTAQSATIGPTGCATLIEAIGPDDGETRYDSSKPFDNVNDYNGYNSATDGGIKDVTNTVITGLASYSATIAITAATLGGIASTDALLITVTVTGPGNASVVLNGYRTRYAPRI